MSKEMSDLEKLLTLFASMSGRRGEFQHYTVRADGRVRAVWHDHAEEFTPEQLQTLLAYHQLPHNRE